MKKFENDQLCQNRSRREVFKNDSDYVYLGNLRQIEVC